MIRQGVCILEMGRRGLDFMAAGVHQQAWRGGLGHPGGTDTDLSLAMAAMLHSNNSFLLCETPLVLANASGGNLEIQLGSTLVSFVLRKFPPVGYYSSPRNAQGR